mgnify:CR=1 FL=1
MCLPWHATCSAGTATWRTIPVDTLKGEDCVETLRYAIAKFREADVVPFNIFPCTAGEVTTSVKAKIP